jgi:hypothetical protein
MPVSKFTCPECETVLRPAKPLASGKRVTCPKCHAQFTVRDPEEDAARAVKPAKKSAAPAKKDPFDDEGPETYAVIKEEKPEEEEIEDEEDEDEDDDGRVRKPKKPQKDRVHSEDLEFRLNIKTTDPRGPAQAALISPSNFLMLVGTLACIVGIGSVAYGAWPFLFSDEILDPAEFFGFKKTSQDDDPEKREAASKRPKLMVQLSEDGKLDLSKVPTEERNRYYDARDERWWILVAFMAGGAFVIAYNAVIIIGGVKMQNMESYTWAMIASIMAFVLSFPGLGQIAALMALTALRSKKVVDGFFYVPPSATPHAKQKKRDVL